MKIKQLLLLLICCSIQLCAQDYIDLVKIANNKTTFETVANDFETQVNNLNIEVYYPTRVNEKFVVITGFTIENTKLNLLQGADSSKLLMTRLNLGIKHQHSEKWSGTYVLLPKLASDFEDIGSRDFQFGALAIFDYQYTSAWKLKFGLYSSSENFGTAITPLIGFWHRSKSKKFYINATLPIRMDANYAIAKNFSFGTDLLTSLKSYHITQTATDFYVQEQSVRFAFYSAIGFINNSLLLKAKIGFDTTDYGLYSSDETIGAQVLTFPLATDSRNRLNSEFDGALFFGADLIYRFDLTKEKKQ